MHRPPTKNHLTLDADCGVRMSGLDAIVGQ
jgi:hypothetical protein